MVPGIQEVANGVNAVWYATEGDWANAGISAAGMIPIAGDAAVGARLVAKGAKAVNELGKGAKELAPAEEAAKKLRPDFVADQNGTIVPTSKSRLEDGFQRGDFPSESTKSPGTMYTLPDGSKARVMEPSGQAGSRASFTDKNGSPISPFTGKSVQPPNEIKGTPEGRQHIRDRTHIPLGP
jgi:hypothetical protein